MRSGPLCFMPLRGGGIEGGRSARGQPGATKGELVMRSAWSPADWPLYELSAKPRYHNGEVAAFIRAVDEPLYRQFFTQVAQLCGRSVAA
jgi:hypothetical protein